MELKKLKHYMHRVGELGLHHSAGIIHNRCKNYLFDVYWRKKAANKKAHHSWKKVTQKLGIHDSWQPWFSSLHKRIIVAIDELSLEKNLSELMQEADDFVDTYFDFLGTGKQRFEHIPWHEDFRLKGYNKHSDVNFDNNLYYKDFVIQAGTTELLIKDIKIPWELSRLQHFFVLGSAYQQTNDVRYHETFEKHFLSWCTENPFLLGPHWACPMDVGIRAVNLVWAFVLFKQAGSPEFWQHFAAVLYDHFFYLENNWEVYDFRTSNHYLSDLLGYFYLCYFFYDSELVQEKAVWCYKELMQEFEKQIFQEGTDYEGSTAYHQLITEIFYHFSIMAKKMGFFVPQHFEEKLKRMFSFIAWCTPNNGQLVHIGDNDSGKILFYGITSTLIGTMKIKNELLTTKHFKEFGLSVLKTNAWHITLRHHAYQERQPSGHFHVDSGSVTAAIDGIAIFTDPGSYVYTPSAFWRNRFRSVDAHSTFYMQTQEPIAVDDRLFLLEIPPQEARLQEHNESMLHTEHNLYQHLGITVYRSVHLVDENTLTISDWIDEKISSSYDWCWNFILNPSLSLQQDGEKIIFLYEEKPLAMLTSILSFEIVDCFVSPQYGVKVASKKLKALQKLTSKQKMVTVVTKLGEIR